MCQGRANRRSLVPSNTARSIELLGEPAKVVEGKAVDLQRPHDREADVCEEPLRGDETKTSLDGDIRCYLGECRSDDTDLLLEACSELCPIPAGDHELRLSEEGRAHLDPAAVALCVDHVDAGARHGDVIDVGPAARYPAVVQQQSPGAPCGEHLSKD